MTATQVKITQFQGSGKLFTRDSDGLAAILRGMLMDNANLKVQVAGVHDFTDDSTGTAVSPPVLPNLTPLPSGAMDASATSIGASLSALNTSLGKLQNACLVMTNTLNEARPLIGLTALTCGAGTQASANVIPAQDRTNAAVEGASAANYTSGLAALVAGAANVYMIAEAANEVLTAIGATTIGFPAISRTHGYTLNIVPTVVADSTGATAAAQADVQGWLIGVAEAIATIAAAWNAAMTQTDTVPLHVFAG